GKGVVLTRQINQEHLEVLRQSDLRVGHCRPFPDAVACQHIGPDTEFSEGISEQQAQPHYPDRLFLEGSVRGSGGTGQSKMLGDIFHRGVKGSLNTREDKSESIRRIRKQRCCGEPKVVASAPRITSEYHLAGQLKTAWGGL